MKIFKRKCWFNKLHVKFEKKNYESLLQLNFELNTETIAQLKKYKN